jgi:uncharacterized protein
MATKDFIGYQALVEKALLSVVRDALKHAASGGVMGPHFFNIVFATGAPGVQIPDWLREKFPDAMKIVLQNQYWDLKVHGHEFEVTLSFNKMPTTIVVPFAAVLHFEDPSQKFQLAFQSAMPPQSRPGPLAVKPAAPLPAKVEPPTSDPPPPDPPPPASPSGDGAVVSLDKFRKK